MEVDAGRLSRAEGRGFAPHGTQQVNHKSKGLVAYWPFDEV